MPVNLELQMSSFAGYDNSETSTYLGTNATASCGPRLPSCPPRGPSARP